MKMCYMPQTIYKRCSPNFLPEDDTELYKFGMTVNEMDAIVV